jgi:hypothetical protein
MEVMKLFKEVRGWEKLEMRMLVVWWSHTYSDQIPTQDTQRVTLTLFQQGLSAIPRFEDPYEKGIRSYSPSIFLNITGRTQQEALAALL